MIKLKRDPILTIIPIVLVVFFVIAVGSTVWAYMKLTDVLADPRTPEALGAIAGKISNGFNETTRGK